MSRRSSLVLGALGVCSSILLRSISAQSSAHTDIPAERQAYADAVSQTYDFHFGKGDISSPGNARVEGNRFIQPGAFPSAEYCGHCHQQAYSQWREALHSNSFRTPFYRTSVNILARTRGIELPAIAIAAITPSASYPAH